MTAPRLHEPEFAELRADLKRCIRASGLRQHEVAARLGITPKHLSQMLTARCGISLHYARRIAEACGHELMITITPKETC